MFRNLVFFFILSVLLLSGCAAQAENQESINVVAAESFLADIAQNIAGDRLTITSLLPIGKDAHTYQPTPKDVARISDSDILIINGGGLEPWLEPILTSEGGNTNVVIASEGLVSRGGSDRVEAIDPHFWLDPSNVLTYVDNITTALITADPAGEQEYLVNAENYKKQLVDLDGWIKEQVATIPVDKRSIITNHESLGYFADRYGFTVVATILEGSSTDAATSSDHMAELIQLIQNQHIQTIFLSAEEDITLAMQLAEETGITVNYDLISHSLTADGETSTYIGMMRHNVQVLMILR